MWKECRFVRPMQPIPQAEVIQATILSELQGLKRPLSLDMFPYCNTACR